MSVIELDGVGRRVRLPDTSWLQILDEVTLEIEAGEHVAVVGRSGSGKSTLLNILGLLDTPDTGQYVLDGSDVTRLSGRARSQLRGRTFGFVFQQFNLLPRRTALENVCVPLTYSTGREFWHRKAYAAEVLELVGLGDRLTATPEHLSGGEQQRVALARALVREPAVLLADEPTGALDIDTGAEVMNLLEWACYERGATLITITHDLAIAARADRQLRLDHGVLVSAAEPIAQTTELPA